MFFAQPWMLLGLAALAIPIIIHLLNRRRYETIDWGAMQFLQISKVTRRRLFLEELLLMLLRMGLIALLVLALAGFFTSFDWLARLQPRPNRDVALIFDGSSSMNYTGGGKTPRDAAKEWAADFVHGLTPGDSVAIFQARQQVVPVVAEPSRDLTRLVPQAVREMPQPGGGCDLPAAVQSANAVLNKSERAERDVIVLTDGQRFGWSDPATIQRWQQLARQIGAGKPHGAAGPPPRLWVVNVDPNRDPDPPNWSLPPLRVNRPVVPVGREVTFRTDLTIHGQNAYTPPYSLSLEVDGELVRRLEPPRASALAKGKIPLTFTHRFANEGSHLVSLVLEPDAPGAISRDTVPDDNRQDFAVEVTPTLPVLIVDGDADPAPKRRGAWSLRDALAPQGDTTPAVKARVVSIKDFDATLLTGGMEPERPRVLILCNAAALSQSQEEAVEQFLADGGGVLTTLGSRVDKDQYNRQLFREGHGWLPAKLASVEGDESRPKDAARPAAVSATHPALDLFRNDPLGGLSDARFPRWWKTDVSAKDAVGERVATLKSPTADYSFLAERRYKSGRVLLCSVPLDSSWGTNLTDLPAFVPLAHELVYYLAGARSAEFNLQPGQPIRYRLTSNAPADGFRLQPPFGEEKPLKLGSPSPGTIPAHVTAPPHPTLVCDETRETGVYRLKTPDGRVVYYVVQSDPRESDLTASTDEERERVAKVLPMQYENDRETILAARNPGEQRQDWWWVLLLGLVGLLCGEVWMTRRMLKAS
jgi:Aerotolerance regulator N-terminal/von Willebrand factor type A domain